MNRFDNFYYHGQNHEVNDLLQTIPLEYKKLGKIMILSHNTATTVFRIVGDHDYALKIVHNCGEDTDRWRSSKREIEILQRLFDCNHVVRLIDSKLDNETNVMVLLEEYCEPLSNFCAMTVFDAIGVCTDVCDALIECRNAGIAHLDVKLENILIDINHVVRLGDFGVSLPLEEMADNSTKLGTIRYMAPEVLREGKCSEQSEIYSVGLLLYLLFNRGTYEWKDGCGEISYYQRLAGMPLESVHIDDEIDSAIMRIVNKACNFTPQDRHECFENLKDDLISLRMMISKTAGNTLLILNSSLMDMTLPPIIAGEMS